MLEQVSVASLLCVAVLSSITDSVNSNEQNGLRESASLSVVMQRRSIMHK